jgi:hydroxymethylpyrimidine pyrophosphatase-like HAD family hydrolase
MDQCENKQKQLEEEGWQFTTLTGGSHLQRILEMYKELGIETRMIAVDPQSCGDCVLCFAEAGETIYKIFIKPLK